MQHDRQVTSIVMCYYDTCAAIKCSPTSSQIKMNYLYTIRNGKSHFNSYSACVCILSTIIRSIPRCACASKVYTIYMCLCLYVAQGLIKCSTSKSFYRLLVIFALDFNLWACKIMLVLELCLNVVLL